MRIVGRFDRRAERLKSVWEAVSSSLEEPTSSLEDFEVFVSQALIAMRESPPQTTFAERRIRDAIRVARAESFQMLDKVSQERLSGSLARLQTINRAVRKVSKEISEKWSPVSTIQAVADNKRYEVVPCEISSRFRNVSRRIAFTKVVTQSQVRILRSMLERVLGRVTYIRRRYVSWKCGMLKRYLEAGENSQILGPIVIDIIAELRTRAMTKQDIRVMRNAFIGGSPRTQIVSFIKGLSQEQQYRVLTSVAGLDLTEREQSVAGMLLHQPGSLEPEQLASTDSVELFVDGFLEVNRDRVVAEIHASGTNPSEACRYSQLDLDALVGCLVLLDPHARVEHPDQMDVSPALVYADGRLSSAMHPGPRFHKETISLTEVVVDDLQKILGSLGVGEQNCRRTTLQLGILRSLHWLRRAVASNSVEERFLDLIVALECLLGGGNARADRWRTISDRATLLRRILKVGREDHRQLMNRIYDIRNEIVHSGAHKLKSLEQDTSDLLGETRWCLVRCVEGIIEGCRDLIELDAWSEEKRLDARRRRLKQSKLQPGEMSSFCGQMLREPDEIIADVAGTIELVDEGEDGWVYHDLRIRNISLHSVTRFAGGDRYWFKGVAQGHHVEIRDGHLLEYSSFVILIMNRAKSFSYRAWDGVAFT